MIHLFHQRELKDVRKKTISYYQYTLNIILNNLNKEILHLTTEDIRGYLDNYQKNSRTTKTTIDNIRSVLSTFF